ncbi:MAG: hypothetical protein KH009_00150 [Clostridiales bacterium]|nr:hypothetical protein [Clostridiales bacterium]
MENMKYPCSIETLFAMRVLLDDMIGQMQRDAQQPKAAELTLICSADKMLAGAGEVITLSGVVKNTSEADAEEIRLAFALPEGFRPLKESLHCDCGGQAGCTGGILIPRLAAGESCIVRLQAAADRLPRQNPVRVGFFCEQGGRRTSAESLCIWVTDRSCCRESTGCCMADVLAQWSLAQLFGLNDCEIALLLEYLQNHREDILSTVGRCR